MKDWKKISGLLCIYGILRETRPSEPYGIEFLAGEWTNLTLVEIYRDAVPLSTYSYLVHLIVIFLVTDFLRYKPLIIVSGIAGIITWAMLIFAKTLFEVQILEVIFGTYLSTEIAYFTYIYAKVDKKYYPKVTSHTRAALLFGKLMASISAQILIYFKWMDYMELNYITLAAQIASTIWALFLPRVRTTVYFHRSESLNQIKLNDENETETTNGSTFADVVASKVTIISKKGKDDKTTSNPFKLLYIHFKNAYTNTRVLQWSIWHALILCGYFQVNAYIQVLWKAIENDPLVAWNGAVEAVLTFFGAIFALIAGYLHAGRLNNRSSCLVVSGVAVCKGSALLLASLSNNLLCAYIAYAVFGALYAFSITVTSAEVASHLVEDSFGLVFGVNTFVALCLQTILTLLVTDETVFVLDIFAQFLVYGSYFIIFGLVFGLSAIIQSVLCSKKL